MIGLVENTRIIFKHQKKSNRTILVIAMKRFAYVVINIE